MYCRLFTILLLFVLTGCSTSRPAKLQTPVESTDVKNDAPLPVDPAVRIGHLSNGLTYYIRANHKPEHRVELRLVVNAGSVLEDDDQQGLAHFTEHMAFNGTAHFKKQKLVDYLESIGMRMGPDLNAYTSFDETVYRLQVPTDSVQQFQQGMQILRDWASDVSFDDTEIDKERGVVIEEWRLGQGAQARIRDKQFPVLFEGSRYAQRLPIGKKDLLEHFPYDAVKRFYRTWYRPDLMAVIVVGDINQDAVEAQLRSLFGDIPVSPNPRPRPVFDVPDHDSTLFSIAGDPEATLGKVGVYYLQRRKEIRSEADYRRQLVERLYHAMFNSRLSELTQQKDPPFLFGVSGSTGLTRTKQAYVLQAAVRDSSYVQALDTLLKEGERVRRFGFTASELSRKKVDLLRRIEQAYNERDKTRSSKFAGEYVQHFLTGEPIPGVAYEYDVSKRLLPGVTLAEINGLAKEWISPSDRVVLVDGPEKDTHTLPTRAMLEKAFSTVASIKIKPFVDLVTDAPLVKNVPTPGQIVSVTFDSLLNVTRWTLTNGVKVVLKPTDFKNDEILLSATSPGGTSLAPDSLYTPALFAAGLVSQSGVGAFGNIELQKKLAGKVVRLNPGIGERSEGFSGSAAPKDAETLFQLVYLYFTGPRADSSAFLSFRQRLSSLLKSFQNSPESAFRDTIQVTMAQHNLRARPFTTATLKAMDLAQSYAFFKDRYADASDFTFYIVGAFDLAEMKPLVLTYLGALPHVNRKDAAVDRGIRPPTGKLERTVYKGKEPKSRVRINLTGNAKWTNRNRRLLRTVTDILGIKLREVLREDLGGVYGVQVSGTLTREPKEEYRVSISFGCDPQRVEELTRTVYGQMDSLRTNGTTATYLDKAKEASIRQHEVGLEENGYWLSSLQFYDKYHLDPDYILSGAGPFFDKLTLDDVRDAARQFLHTANRVRVVLYPEGFSH